MADTEKTLDIILNHHTEGKRLIIRGRDVEVQCVDQCYYKRRFKNKKEAEEANSLIAIFPSIWRKQQ